MDEAKKARLEAAGFWVGDAKDFLGLSAEESVKVEAEVERRLATSKEHLTAPLKWHGGKHYLARRIVDLMPPHTTYCEPYAGGLSVLLAKPCEGVSEVVNDLSRDLTNFWDVLRCGATFDALQRILEATPFCEETWKRACKHPGPWPEEDGYDVPAAFAFFVRCRQSLAGRMTSFTGVTKTRTRRGMNNEVSAWLSAVEGLPAVHARLKRVLVLNRPALDVIAGQDGPQTLFYIDSPYLHETRATTDDYAHEMMEQDHRDLLDLLAKVKGKFLLSGYRSEMYDAATLRQDWRRVDFEVANHASSAKSKRRMVESVWSNFVPEAKE